MNSRYLLMWLEAPLQSWGADSKFGRRDTLPFPTRSGVLGLLLCALGASGEQKELLARLAPYGQTVISCARTRPGRSGGQPEKIPRQPLLRDFHMVGSAYDDKDPWERLHIPKTSEGKPAVGGGAKLTYRYYLQDARFAVVLDLPPDLAEDFAQALQNPVWDIYLGRKNCAPTEFVFQGVFDSQKDAMDRAAALMEEKELMEDFRVVDGEHPGEPITLNDVPLQFGPMKKYRDRRVTVIRN
ncbi:type I-E CRISPR-associated protein Cas5/CasD [Desulfatibacillum aliphaticivorans]|uniref:type I-E CRISPR-associated protein Cas5/CasD n=1 Tax=Desulfatibacillum aliphaticivorans TaxID=218208 RepID=UPI000487184E|nr:type I-E CRISPR-associated protein Cas5/CasD [Desulfatibacillum aliphaticivorans]